MLTKKGMQVIAKHIRTMMNPEQRLNAAVAVAAACAEMNPRFDSQKFFEACNVR